MGMLVGECVSQGLDLLGSSHLYRRSNFKSFSCPHQRVKQSRRPLHSRSSAATSVGSYGQNVVVVGGGWAGRNNDRLKNK